MAKKPKASISDKVQSKESFEVTVEKVAPPPYVPGTKKVFSFHPRSGEFAGEAIADESPLEPGVWHLPANSTDVTPPEFQAGMVRVWNGSAWEFKTDEQKQERGAVEEDKAAAIISQRNARLFATDWTQLADAPKKPGWLEYRQALRDITKQKDFPNSVVWPEPPTK